MSGRLILANSAEKTAAIYYFCEVMLMGVTQCSPALQARFHRFDYVCIVCHAAAILHAIYFHALVCLHIKTLMGSKTDCTTVKVVLRLIKLSSLAYYSI